MNKARAIFIILFLSYPTFANFIQFPNKDIRFSVSASQSATDDWKQGKVQSLTTNSALDYKQVILIDTLKLKFQFKSSIGVKYTNTEKKETETFLPTDNKLFSEGVLTYPVGWKVDPFISASFSTQLTESFRMLKDDKVRTAMLWDPVTSQQSFGFEKSYKGKKNSIGSNLGISLKPIRSHYYTKTTDDRKTKDIVERWKTQTGVQWKTSGKWQISKSTNYRGMIDMFATYDELDKWTVKNTNEFKITIYKYLAVLIKINLIYDDKQALYWQYNENMSLSIVADF